MQLDESLLNFEFPPKYHELLLECRSQEIAVHEVEDGFEMVVCSVFLDERREQPQVHALLVPLNGNNDLIS